MTSSAETTGSTTTGPHPLPRNSAEARPEPAVARWRRVLYSPADQPRWARPILLVIAAFAAALYSWNITTAGYAPFYSSSVKSMSVSWKAWLFGAMDPGATITLDKIPGAFAIQALFARVLGFHEWSVTLPQVIEGVIAVLVLYRVVRRWAGPAAGLIASALFTFTPVVASMFGHSMEDGALTCCLLLAADRFQVAVGDGRLRPLIWAGFWVGVGFQMKMMQAWMVLPAFALAYLLSAPGSVRRRIRHLLTAGVVCIAVSLTWVAMMEIVPAKDRPYVDGSTNNSAVAMVFGYNGLERFGIHVPGAVEDSLGGGGSGGVGNGGAGVADLPRSVGSSGVPGFPGAAGGSGFPGYAGSGASSTDRGQGPAVGGFGAGGGGSKWLKLFEGRYADQIGWMIPLALLSMLLGLWRRRHAERTDSLRGGFVFWGGWLVVVGLVFSEMSSIPHTAYMSMLAPAISALCGAGLVSLWRMHRQNARPNWMVPSAVAGQAAWTWYLWSDYADFAAWLRWSALLTALAAIAALLVARAKGLTRARLGTIAAVAALATTGVGTVAWASTAFDARDDGSAFDASAGPQAGGFSMSSAGSAGAGAAGGAGGLIATGTMTGDQARLWRYVTAHQDGADYPLATVGWTSAQDYILATGAKVLPIGGFSGQVPQPTLSEFTVLVHEGKLHYVLTSGSGAGMGGSMMTGLGGDTANTTSTQITSWTEAHCTAVPSTDYGSSGSSGSLYRCDTGS
ncbi:MAG TPA: glycosyltransferase family 39 protein [Actinospica sp.]|nr:glycosyltransferase family 39 protein [Actinospica sp.]